MKLLAAATPDEFFYLGYECRDVPEKSLSHGACLFFLPIQLHLTSLDDCKACAFDLDIKTHQDHIAHDHRINHRINHHIDHRIDH